MSVTWIQVLQGVGMLLTGGGFTLLGMVLKRRWETKDKKEDVTSAITSLGKKIDNVKSSIMAELAKDRADNEEYRIKMCRQRILQFNDEIYRGVRHTKESFDDVIAEGIDVYEDYCKTHPTFPNFKAEAAIENIKETYKKCLKEGTFLSQSNHFSQ
jgi:hypothetical protein